MISIELLGRVGNQLFQISALKAWSLRTGFEPFYPKWDQAHYFAGDFSNKTDTFVPQYIYQEPHFHYNPLPKVDDCVAKGYFQSEKYFEHCSNEIREMFTIKDGFVSQKTKDLAKIPNLVGVHCRRGDYVSTYADHFHVQNMDYYNKSMSLFPGANFVICSDDQNWCKENFIGQRFTFSEGNIIDDLWLLSHCEHNVMGNSSYSWWGAWLNKNPDKKVVAPAKWFNWAQAHNNTSDLYCKDWIII